MKRTILPLLVLLTSVFLVSSSPVLAQGVVETPPTMSSGSVYSFPPGCGGTADPLSCYNDCWQRCATGVAGCVIWCQNNDPSGNYKKYQQSQAQNNQTPGEFYGGAGASIRSGWATMNYSDHRITVLNELSTGSIGLEAYLLAILNGTANGVTFLTWENGTADSLTQVGQPRTWRPGGATGFLSDVIVSTYANPPASSTKYVQYLAENAGFPNPIKEAYAQFPQGVGFKSLNPIIELWKIIRNLTYALFAMVFVALGLMIMLRLKVDAKTIVSVQNSLPRIFITLILITFSYPIAGFAIDIMYVLIAAVFSLVRMTGLLGNAELQAAETVIKSQNIFDTFYLLSKTSANVATSLNSVLLSIFSMFGSDIRNAPVLGGAATKIVESLGSLVISIMVIRALFMTFLQMLFAYGGIIFGTIFGPLAILPDVVPGQNAFVNWLKNIFGNALVFPMVVGLLLIGQLFSSPQISSQASGAVGGTFFAPPLIGIGDANSFRGIMALLIILLLPATSQMAQDLLGTKPFKYGTVWGESFKWIKEKASGVTKLH